MFLLPLAGLIGQNNAQAATGSLTDGNSSISLDLSSSAGMTSWLINGVNQVQQQWFWFRVGTSGGEQDISTISAPTITQSLSRQLTVAYDLPGQYGVTVKYNLTGGSNPQLSEAVTIFNHTAGALDFHFFQYGHVTLANSTANQSVAFTSDLSGITSVGQTGPGGQSYQEAFLNSGNRAEAGLLTDSPNTLAKLSDSNPTTLNNNASAGPGDPTYAVQWDFTINPGASKPVSIIIAVPEPSLFALGGLAVLALFQLKRQRASKTA
jgi:hypothetical protein